MGLFVFLQSNEIHLDKVELDLPFLTSELPQYQRQYFQVQECCFLCSHGKIKHHIISSFSKDFILLIDVSKPKPDQVLWQEMWVFNKKMEEVGYKNISFC